MYIKKIPEVLIYFNKKYLRVHISCFLKRHLFGSMSTLNAFSVSDQYSFDTDPDQDQAFYAEYRSGSIPEPGF